MHPLSRFHYKRIHSPSGPRNSPTSSTPTPDPTYCVICQCRVATRDSGTQLARGINWIQSSSLQAKKNEPSNPEQMEFCVLFAAPSIQSPSHPLFCPPPCHRARQEPQGVMRHSTDWELPRERD